MEVLILRHGTTDLNEQGLIQGSGVNPDLSVKGRAYAQKAAKNFDSSSLDAIYASPLKRAQETAQIFVDDKKIVTDERLTELNFGSWDGKEIKTYKQQHPDAFDSQGLITENMYKYSVNAETRKDLEQRIASFMDDLYQDHKNDRVLIVCHGVVSRMICAHYLTHGDISYFAQLNNCGLAQMYIDNDITRLSFYGRVLA